MTTKQLCLLGLLFFLISYLFFSKVLPDFQLPIDFAHWFNLIGACFLLSFNDVFPKNRINAIASFVTTLGVVAHVGLCTIDFIMWSFGNNEVAKEALSSQISNTPSILYPFVKIKKEKPIDTAPIMTIAALIVFVLKNGIYMLLSCVVFIVGLGLLLYRTEIERGDTKQKEFTKL